MEGTRKPHTDKYMKIMNTRNYDFNCKLTSFPVSVLHFTRLVFAVQSVPPQYEAEKVTTQMGRLFRIAT